jgi:hypothetical protein
MSANTLSSRTYRDKYRSTTLQMILRKALVAQAICNVDSSDTDRIQNPYSSQPTTVVQAISGTYSVAAWTTTDDTLTVSDEFIVAEQVYDFEQVLTAFDMFANRANEQAYSVATKIDQYVLNVLALEAGTTYSTAAGGFGTPANVSPIMASLAGLISGYQQTYNGMFLVIENTEMAGFAQAQVAQGFSYSDMALRNGFMNSYMGIEIYVVRTGTFITGTVGTRTFANSGHRVFGVKNLATYAAPRRVQFTEKEVSGKTGKELATWGYIGAHIWVTQQPLFINITLN